MITRVFLAISLHFIITAVVSTADDTPHYLSRTSGNPNPYRTSGNPPCLQSCDENGAIKADTLQKCVEKCANAGYCCGNRLENEGEVKHSSNDLLSCANGCEIAFYSKTVDECMGECDRGNNHPWCYYRNPYQELGFFKCGECACNKSPAVSSTDCRDGCLQAENLEEFYLYDPKSCSGPEDIPRFLFAGQSNMIGVSEHARKDLFLELMNTMTAKGKRNGKVRKMRDSLKITDGSTLRSSWREANLIFKLGRYIKKKEFNTGNYNKAVCSFTRPDYGNRLHCERNLSAKATCGNPFGPELMFGHVFPKKKSPLKGKRVGIIKIAAGGTQLNPHWMKVNDGKSDNYWQYLVDSITASNGTIEAFVWFQGENDSFGGNNTKAYLDNLTTFIGDVRNEITQSSSKFKTPEDVPVVIVELGSWIYHANMAVIEAQRTFVNNTANTTLVHTGANDNPDKRLSEFYHYNAASQMIIGDRIARSLAKLLRES